MTTKRPDRPGRPRASLKRRKLAEDDVMLDVVTVSSSTSSSCAIRDGVGAYGLGRPAQVPGMHNLANMVGTAFANISRQKMRAQRDGNAKAVLLTAPGAAKPRHGLVSDSSSPSTSPVSSRSASPTSDIRAVTSALAPGAGGTGRGKMKAEAQPQLQLQHQQMMPAFNATGFSSSAGSGVMEDPMHQREGNADPAEDLWAPGFRLLNGAEPELDLSLLDAGMLLEDHVTDSFDPFGHSDSMPHDMEHLGSLYPAMNARKSRGHSSGAAAAAAGGAHDTSREELGLLDNEFERSQAKAKTKKRGRKRKAGAISGRAASTAGDEGKAKVKKKRRKKKTTAAKAEPAKKKRKVSKTKGKGAKATKATKASTAAKSTKGRGKANAKAKAGKAKASRTKTSKAKASKTKKTTASKTTSKKKKSGPKKGSKVKKTTAKKKKPRRKKSSSNVCRACAYGAHRAHTRGAGCKLAE